MDRDRIKNKMRQIFDEKVKISHEFPNINNMAKNRYARFWLATIFIDICGYTDFCERNKSNPIYIGKTLRAFHEGIIDILQEYSIKNIDIQGDGIFGVIECPEKNCDNAKKIFDAAMDINGFLYFYWKKLPYKISISLSEELIMVIRNGKNIKLVYAGGSVNTAKKLMDKSNLQKCI